MECYNCHGLGHYQYECPKRENDRANYGETNEEMLLMAYVDEKKAEKKDIWFLDSECSNHMCRKKNFSIILMRSFDKLLSWVTTQAWLRWAKEM